MKESEKEIEKESARQQRGRKGEKER